MNSNKPELQIKIIAIIAALSKKHQNGLWV